MWWGSQNIFKFIMMTCVIICSPHSIIPAMHLDFDGNGAPYIFLGTNGTVDGC
ncbi:hypothetical protein BIFBRE_05071 [Bifidobacterium breve DSM 20213 = JCM 1192]|uniref:Uncharacterized protein n=1 Tax=Bifidobacterium breve DSM 20213 = JCM 1192 TaxID=518634 RepID=D4BSH9_BIFBR|nr:hypothetical protein BIFBRE_05071 [Bifidobacterium breve DSM 20213 = JCM 1192]